jgi:hypothetical protein
MPFQFEETDGDLSVHKTVFGQQNLERARLRRHILSA